jgi:predicted NUDIX family phosphoesterase
MNTMGPALQFKFYAVTNLAWSLMKHFFDVVSTEYDKHFTDFINYHVINNFHEMHYLSKMSDTYNEKRVHKNLLSGLILSQMNPVHTFPFDFLWNI